MDLSRFYTVTTMLREGEQQLAELKETLETLYAELVPECPHSEAIEFNFGNRSGDYRVCKICGIEDLASHGGTPGDEYDYGYPGRPDPNFWKGTYVVKANSEKEFWSYRRRHGWRVVNGRAEKR